MSIQTVYKIFSFIEELLAKANVGEVHDTKSLEAESVRLLGSDTIFWMK